MLFPYFRIYKEIPTRKHSQQFVVALEWKKKLGPDYEGPLMPFKGFWLLSCRQLEAVEGLKQRNDT